MSDAREKNSQIANAPIAGPSAEELFRPFSPKSLDQIAREQQQQIEKTLHEFKTGGSK